MASLKNKQREKLLTLARRWKRKENRFMRAAMEERRTKCDFLAANRYEGESIALRWCREDLLKAIL